MPSEPEPDRVEDAVAEAHRQSWAVVVAATARHAGGDLGLAEEVSAEAYLRALETWGRDGIPVNPAGWLVAVARRLLIDQIRRQANLRAKLKGLTQEPPGVPTTSAPVLADHDDRLRLVFICAHPALAIEARVALTLRMVGGLSTGEIARAFLVPEPTMAARITRAKKKIAAAAIPYRVPGDDELEERLDGVLAVLYLIFNEGYLAVDEHDLVRPELVQRAIDLAKVLNSLLPGEPEPIGLLALMILHHARRDARLDGEGRLVLLADQDRGRWDRAAIDAALQLIERAAGLTTRPGRFLLQASIAAAHTDPPTAADVDWSAIVSGYDRLQAIWPNPIVALNRAAAMAHAEGSQAALDLLDQIADEPQLRRYHYLPATRADLLTKVGRTAEADAAYADALALLKPGTPEHRLLASRRAAL